MIESVTFFGTPCGFANLVLNRVLENGYHVAAHVVPGPRDQPVPVREFVADPVYQRPRVLPMSGQRSAKSPCTRMFEVSDHSSESTVCTLAGLDSDLAVVCCYPRRLPESLVNTARYGGVNVHPSLLPRYRGPDPLFWIYRNGETDTGVTIHRVDAELDSGEIFRQQRIDLPVGSAGNTIWMNSAEVGATLLLQSIEAISSGKAEATPQDVSQASYFSWPSAADMMIDPLDWDAWHVYHFCRGVIPLGHMPRLVVGEQVRRVIGADGYVDQCSAAGKQSPASEVVRCRDGEVYLRLGPSLF